MFHGLVYTVFLFKKKKKAKTFSFKLNNQNSTWWGDLTNFNVITYSVHITVFPISNDISKILKGFFFLKEQSKCIRSRLLYSI